MAFENYTFEVSEQHVKLLKNACVGWNDCEFGAPAIDGKRPYGNSNVLADMAKILGIDPNDADKDELRKLHQETQTALQIFLVTGEMKAGKYEAERDTNDWKLIG